MPFRSIDVDPHELAKLGKAFDAAWMGINCVDTIGAVAQNKARQRLAEIILDLWREDRDQLSRRVPSSGFSAQQRTEARAASSFGAARHVSTPPPDLAQPIDL